MKITNTIKSTTNTIKAKKGNIKLAAESVGLYILGVAAAPVLVPLEIYCCIKNGESMLGLDEVLEERITEMEEQEAKA